MKIEKVYESQGIRIGVAGPVIVCVYLPKSSIADLDQVDTVESKLLTKYPRIASFSVVPVSGQSRVEEGIRQRSLDLVKKFDGKLHGVATIVTGNSLGVAMVRTFLTGFNLMSKSKSPARAFSAFGEATAWMKTIATDGAVNNDKELAKEIEAFAA